ncbi:ABC transporter permease subunit [candidate division KSB3 bacterium]|uniref:ABC transporter permease subunit n=1 Tax=candidate division KSB3 bacterium TaxID=2044937 RepID=A0A9D5Q5M1_9BACT|nr:ABC transporter permease subunit [candidate division KSB3 bacterium]MBD3324387.1 ABC transporter permease subunit [candidate division KSB3 bacterium]
MNKRSKSTWSAKRILIGVAIFVCLAWAVFPFYWAATTSLRKPAETFTVAGLAIPFLQFKPTLENWKAELTVPENLRAIRNSSVIAVTSALFATALGTMAGYGLARFKFQKPRNPDLTIWFLSQRVLPPVVVAIPFFLLARQFQALDKVSTLIVLNTTFNLPFAVIIMSQLFKELPVELEQAALVDGYSRVGAFFKVALPLSTPGLVATAIICLAFAWNEFMFALIMAQRKAITLPYIISGASDTRGIQFWFIATRALMAIVPPTILALTVQKFIVRGLTFGAVKG